ncbi:MAG: hypothetical protein K2M91_01850 [Lachnospiraceae bacterium]|nr:hypothetical protein [Lachnospiraceae bacterium]
MQLTCITELPCPHQKDMDGIGYCMKNEGDCEYQMLDTRRKKENMDSETRYCYSWDGERYFGDYATEEEALKDAKSEALHEEVYIGTCTEPELRWHCIGETLIDQIEDNLYDDVGEIAKSFEVSAEDKEELERRLNSVIEGWLKDRNIKPDCYQVFDGHRVTLED